MSAAALQAQDALRPRGDNRLGLGAALALLAHGGLVGALALGLNWRLPQPPVAASAELWAAVPQAAAPAPVAAPLPAPVPPPAPVPAPAPPPPSPASPPVAAPKPQPAPTPPCPSAAEREAAIALEKAVTRKKEQDAQKAKDAAERERQRLAQEAAQRQQQKLEQKHLADDKAQARQRELQAKAEKAEKAAEDKRQKLAGEQREKAQKEAEAKAQEAQVAKQREENLKRMLGQAGASGNATSTGNAARDAAPSAAYAGKIKAFIKPNILLAVDVPGNPITEVEVKLAPDGSVINQRIVKASGNPTWDSIVQRAIEKTARLPRDSDGRVPPTMLLVFPRKE